jgi:hypothetical protein
MAEISSGGNEESLLARLWISSVVISEILSCSPMIGLLIVTNLAIEDDVKYRNGCRDLSMFMAEPKEMQICKF